MKRVISVPTAAAAAALLAFAFTGPAMAQQGKPAELSPWFGNASQTAFRLRANAGQPGNMPQAAENLDGIDTSSISPAAKLCTGQGCPQPGLLAKDGSSDGVPPKN